MILIDPLSLFLVGTCCLVCWPCFLPLCLSLPLIPYPMILMKTRSDIKHQQQCASQVQMRNEIVPNVKLRKRNVHHYLYNRKRFALFGKKPSRTKQKDSEESDTSSSPPTLMSP